MAVLSWYSSRGTPLQCCLVGGRWRHSSDTARHYWNILLAIVFFFIAQMLTCLWDQPFWAYDIDFPGQIVAMVFVWLAMWIIQVALFKPEEGLEKLYYRHLRAPTEILNKHMSIGFTVPFLSLISQPFAGAEQVGLLTTAFVVTGILNATLVYVVAYNMHRGLTRLMMIRVCRGIRGCQGAVLDVEAAQPPVDTTRSLTSTLSSCPPAGIAGDHKASDGDGEGGRVGDRTCLDRSRKHISDASTLCTMSGYASDLNGRSMSFIEDVQGGGGGQTPNTLRASDGDETGSRVSVGQLPSCSIRRAVGAVLSWVQQNVFLASSILLFLLVGLPLSCLRQNDLFLDIAFLFTVWLTFTSAQTRVKQHITNSQRPHQSTHLHHIRSLPRKTFLTALATLLNPVLWTSLFLLCYGLAKSHIRQEPTAAVVARFKTNNSVSDLIAQHIDTSYLTPSLSSSSSSFQSFPLGAGDIATSILNAGIVSWGLKLFEYRAQLVSRSGAAVLLTSALAALANVVAWPLLARAVGVRPAASALSFAARSATIALGGPALASLGGDAGINAVGVVVNGICFQLVAGCFVGAAEGGEGFAGVVGRCKRAVLRRAAGRCVVVREKKEEVGGSSSSDGGSAGEEACSGGAGEKSPRHRRAPSAAECPGRPAPHEAAECDDGRSRALRHSADATTRMGRVGVATEETWQTSSPPEESHAVDDNQTSAPRTAAAAATAAATAETLDGHKNVADVAAGVTIGINAAAMGTVHLYEQGSRAAPYSALAMTMFGVFTVLFTVQSPMTAWLRVMVGA